MTAQEIFTKATSGWHNRNEIYAKLTIEEIKILIEAGAELAELNERKQNDIFKQVIKYQGITLITFTLTKINQ